MAPVQAGVQKPKDSQKSSALITMTNNQVAQYIPVKSESRKRQRSMISNLYDNDEVMSDVMKRAREVQANLAPEFPSIIKHMQPSHVTGGFCMCLPKHFCGEHLPKADSTIVLEDESGNNYETKYLVRKIGLSAGWRGFSIDHNLSEGDVVVFQLVRPTKFKVYIVRVNDTYEEGALSLEKLHAGLRQMNPNVVHAENLIVASEEMDDGTNVVPTSDQHESESESEDLGFEISDGIRMLETTIVDFKEVKSFEDFDIVANGLVINCELSKHIQKKYYALCCSQKSFLHEHLLEGLNCKLITGIIAETVNVADAIRSSKLTTSQGNFVTWEKTLKAFERLGMNVGFLLARLGQLMSLAAKSQRLKEAKLERVNAEEEMRTLEAKLLEVKETMDGLDVEIESLEKMDNLELMFQKVVEAPW